MSPDTESRIASNQTADGSADTNSTTPIVFFDGVCALCNHAVQSLLKMDRHRRLKFAPLQGETAKRYLPEVDIQELKTLVISDQRGIARYSTAVVRILGHVGGFWSLVSGCLWLIPRPTRDWGYRFVSARRYRWFGKHESCRMPRPGEREQFLP